MRRFSQRLNKPTASAVLAASAVADDPDFGQKVEKMLNNQSQKFFGFQKPSNAFALNVARAPGQTANDLAQVAQGSKATLLTRKAADLADMFAFWPNDATPAHLIFCIEGAAATIVGTVPPDNVVAKRNPSVQRLNTAPGEAETILRGMSRCDGIRGTPWNTILATEETTDGAAYEILEPLVTTNHSVTDRALGTVVDAANVASTKVAKRTALPTMAWEGLDITAQGVVIGGDELRLGTGTLNSDGGGIFKFVPITQPDNLAFQPVTGMVYIIEDNANGDIWACLRDGTDRDIKTDGCVRMLTVKDQSAEPTGFAFTADGKTAYLSIQHSGDATCTAGTDCQDVDGVRSDDIVEVTGFKVPLDGNDDDDCDDN